MPRDDDGNFWHRKPDVPAKDWTQFLQTEDCQPITNLANAALTLREAPGLKGIVAYDEMLRLTLVTRSLPGSRMAAVAEPRPVEDTDVAAIQEWMQRHDMRRMSKTPRIRRWTSSDANAHSILCGTTSMA